MRIAVSAIGAKPTGMVKVRVDGRLVRQVSLDAAGRARTVLHRFRVGKHKVVVIYPGSVTTKPSRAATTFKVTKR